MNSRQAMPRDEAMVCSWCGKEIRDGHWFARLPEHSRSLIFCCPRCLEKYLQRSEPAEAWSEWDEAEHHFQFQPATL